MKDLRNFLSVLRGLTPYPVQCNRCSDLITAMSRRAADIFKAHRHLLCPCGGHMLSIYGGSR